jgi:hypothetical protein
MKRGMTQYKEWLENEGKKEGMEIKVRFIKNDYSAWYEINPAWVIKLSRCIGTIKIPEDLFISESPKFTEKERKAIGLHELGHLKTLKRFGYRGVNRRQRKNKKWIESRADAYVKRREFGKYFASGLKKCRKLKEKLRRKSWWWRIKIRWRKRTLSHYYPDFDKRIKKLVDC